MVGFYNQIPIKTKRWVDINLQHLDQLKTNKISMSDIISIFLAFNLKVSMSGDVGGQLGRDTITSKICEINCWLVWCKHF